MTNWNDFIKMTGKSYEEVIDILASYGYVKKSDSTFSTKAINSGLIVWDDKEQQILLTDVGLNEFLDCCSCEVDKTLEIKKLRSSKYSTGLKMLQKIKGY